MNPQQYGFAQVPCSRCGTTVWISPQMGMGYCPACQQPNQLPAGAAAAAPPPQAPLAPGWGGAPQAAPAPGWGGAPAAPGQVHGQPYGGGVPPAFAPGAHPQLSGYSGMAARSPKLALFAAFGFAVIVGFAMIGWAMLKDRIRGMLDGSAKYKVSWSEIGQDAKKPDGDALRAALAPRATKWKGDAVWWSMNFQAVRPDGTLDVSKGAELMFVSPTGVRKATKKLREDSIKKFKISSGGADFTDRWDATEQWGEIAPPRVPACTLKQLAASLASAGLTGDKTVRVDFDPKWVHLAGLGEDAYHVIGEDPKIDAWYSFSSCAKLK